MFLITNMQPQSQSSHLYSCFFCKRQQRYTLLYEPRAYMLIYAKRKCLLGHRSSFPRYVISYSWSTTGPLMRVAFFINSPPNSVRCRPVARLCHLYMNGLGWAASAYGLYIYIYRSLWVCIHCRKLPAF